MQISEVRLKSGKETPDFWQVDPSLLKVSLLYPGLR